MAKDKKKTEKQIKVGGPFLAAAIFCNDILEDSNKTISVAGIIDGIMIQLSSSAPADMPSRKSKVPIAMNILLVFRTGDSPGKHNLRLMMQSPSGKRTKLHSQEIVLSEEPHGGANVKMKANLSLYSKGVFWIDVILDGKRYTRMPLNVIINRAVEPQPPTNKP
jgi:hypothetical protein